MDSVSYSTPGKKFTPGAWDSALPGSEMSTPAATPHTHKAAETPKTPVTPLTPASPIGQGRTQGSAMLKTAPARWAWELANSIALLLLNIYLLLPYRVLHFFIPGFLKPTLEYASFTGWENITLPVTTFVQQTSFWILSQADSVAYGVSRRVINTHKGNMNHFRVAFEGYLRLIEQKAAIVEQHGLAGIKMALFEH